MVSVFYSYKVKRSQMDNRVPKTSTFILEPLGVKPMCLKPSSLGSGCRRTEPSLLGSPWPASLQLHTYICCHTGHLSASFFHSTQVTSGDEGLTLKRRSATPVSGTGGKEKGVDTDAGGAVGSVVGGDQETGQVAGWRKVEEEVLRESFDSGK